MGRIGLAEQNYAQAIQLLYQSLPAMDIIHNQRGWTAGKLASLAEAFQSQGDFQRAARLLGATELCFTKRIWNHDLLTQYAHSVASTKAALGEVAFYAAWAEGQAMTLEQAVAYAMEKASASEKGPESPSTG